MSDTWGDETVGPVTLEGLNALESTSFVKAANKLILERTGFTVEIEAEHFTN